MPLTEAQKEKKKEYNKQYREANKEKLKEQKKEYKEANKNKIAECQKKWYLENKEQIKQQTKEYRENNKEKIKEYRENNKEKIKEQTKEYKQTETGIKCQRISKWKQYGVISDDYNKLYNIYINTTNCEECNIELVEGMYGKNKKCLDHDHTTGQFRNVLCNTCNIRRG